MPQKEKKKEEIDPNLQLALDYLNKNCVWLKESLGDKWFLEFAKGLRFFVETHDYVIDYPSACRLLNKNRDAIEKSTDVLFNFKVGAKGKETRRFDNDPELRNMLFSLVSASVVIAKVYHIDPLVYIATLSLECPGKMREFREQLDSMNKVKPGERKHSKTGKGAFQLTYNSTPRILINGEMPNWQINGFQDYLSGFNTDTNLAGLQQDIDFSNPAFLHVNPFANVLGATLTFYWFLYERNVKTSKKGKIFGPADLYLDKSAKKGVLRDYNGGKNRDWYSEEFMNRYEYFKKAIEGGPFSGDWCPIVAKL